jgi:ATP-dependent Clp protease ATP-binding subunit ClpC
VVERFCLAHKVPRILVDRAMRLDLRGLEQTLNTQVLGQPEAIRAVVQVIGLIKAGLSDARRPFGVFLFVGPTGVGKTHVAQLLAQYLFGSRDRLIRINMADYPGEYDPLVLFGSPHAEHLREMRGVLTQRVAGQPFGVLLLDEFEKCHRQVHDRFLQLADEGSFVNGVGESVSCRSMIIIATSNAGAQISAIGFVPPARVDDLDRQLDQRLEEHFRVELLNRFDRIVHFHPLSREHIRRIALRELEALHERPGVRQGRWGLLIDESVVDWLAAHGYDPEHGARFLRRTIERHVATALAENLVREDPAPGTIIQLAVRQNRVVAGVEEPAAPAPGARARVEMPAGRGAEKRSLDRERLIAEAAKVLEAARPKLAGLQARRDEHAALLARINAPTFWDDRPAARAVLDRFRDLDVAIQIEGRLAKALSRLADLDRRLATRDELSRFASGLEEAARALREWEERTAEEGPAAVWIVVENADPLRGGAADWIAELVDMEIGWCRRARLAAAAVAFGQVEDEVVRVVLEAEGPGALALLAMEAGIHRRWRRQAADARARIDVLPKGRGPDTDWPGVVQVRRRRGLFGLQPAWRGRLELAERGTTIELLGESRSTLSHVLGDLRDARMKPPVDAVEVARIYGDESGGARDPRTGVSVPRLKDVLRGNLDRFLDGWRRGSASG